MMNGKAVTRALRGHFLTDSALWILLLRSLLDVDSVSHVGSLTHADLLELRAVYDNMVAHNLDLSDSLPSCLTALDEASADQKRALAAESRTAKLWLQYLTHVDVLRAVIRAERTSDWNLHLVAVSRMLHLFASSGHYHYAMYPAVPANDATTSENTPMVA